jgi:hypothetical protein
MNSFPRCLAPPTVSAWQAFEFADHFPRSPPTKTPPPQKTHGNGWNAPDGSLARDVGVSFSMNCTTAPPVMVVRVPGRSGTIRSSTACSGPVARLVVSVWCNFVHGTAAVAWSRRTCRGPNAREAGSMMRRRIRTVVRWTTGALGVAAGGITPRMSLRTWARLGHGPNLATPTLPIHSPESVQIAAI